MASNRMAQASSAYLRSAEHQPVEWYEFGEEAFQKAKDLDRPILLDIGAVWCHWCHVIDRESYENAEIAQYINDHYVAIKVDRDQRPDVDARYQQVIASISGQGGWPLTGFLTHDGRVIYGGTYFPPQAMQQLLSKIHELYHEKKAELFESSAHKTHTHAPLELNDDPSFHPENLAETLQQYVQLVFKEMRSRFDPQHGGFGNQPKFPHFSAIELLIHQVIRTPQDTAQHRQIIEKTLDEMALGGVYDQLYGGFHRYSVDAEWHVPHFEKMAYDNAEALKVYAMAYRLFEKPLYLETVKGTAEWVLSHLADPEKGGFYASQDADIDLNDDGDHFTWSLDEVRDILTPQEYEVVVQHYELTPGGDVHGRHGRNVLRIRQSAQQISKTKGIPEATVRDLLDAARVKMIEARQKRPVPFIDKTLYTNWNGMMIQGFFEAGMWLEEPRYTEFAQKSLDRILKDYWSETGLHHTAGIPAVLDDYAQLAMACFKAYQATGQIAYWNILENLLTIVMADFEDKTLAGWFDIPQSNPLNTVMSIPHKPMEDNPSPAANAVLMLLLNAVLLLKPNPDWENTFQKAFALFVPQYSSYGLYTATLAIAALQQVSPPLKIEFMASPEAHQAAALAYFYPGKILHTATTETLSGPSQTLVCLGQQCLAPVQAKTDLTEELDRLLAPQSATVTKLPV